ncbi:glycosyltransferase family 2 protein [Solidesulfovibrio alcoholivorans]|uniref:glycosyltransferase family 2 protein n=1 Tax=Solidesulfovibrio alcoholivorans TaxID=81406 RepID=UPI000693E00C|nr:glycosyltransferase family 2 protein [Solidesulfovibrio alcoholivorans]
MPTLDVTFVLPCLNEAQALPAAVAMAREALALLAGKGFSGEIIVSDNGSTDGSPLLAASLGCRVAHCPQRGYGSALRYGIEAANGTYVVMGDADASYDFREAVPMVEKLTQGCDLCMGSRFKGGIEAGAMPWKNRHIGNPALTGILNLFFRTGCSDAHCGLRAFTRQAYERMHLTSTGMEFASEMVVKAALLKLRVAETPVTLHKDARGRPPHLNPWRDGWRHLKFLLLYSPLWLFFLPAVASVLFGCGILAVLLTTPPGQDFRFGPFWMGDHWLVIGTSAITIGYYLGILGVAALAYHANQTFMPQSRWVYRLTRFVTVENMCLIGGGLCLVGLAILGYVVAIWVSTLAQGLALTRVMALGAMFVTMGILTFFSGFLFVFFSEPAASGQTSGRKP